MKTLQIKIEETKKNRTYPIHIGKNLLVKIGELVNGDKYSKIFVLTDTIVAPLLLEKIVNNFSKEIQTIIILPGEKEKNIETLQYIWKQLIEKEADRKSLLINLGGGVIGDIGGLAAATYMRGMDFINIPTTILAQVDESVGGKTMIDFSGIKNIVGTFHQPVGVIIDVTTVKTLPKREVLSGFAEIIKHGLIKDKQYFEKVTSKHPLEFSEDEIVEIITQSCEIKAAIVQSDETESGSRKILNFGHTIGHAIEALSLETNKPLTHGEAISISMIAEAIISQSQGLLQEKEVKLIEQSLQNAELPINYKGLAIDDILQKMKSDKKNAYGKINFTLLKEIGNPIYDQQVSEQTIIHALKKVIR
jgi:3-dehydroquinate synthase